MLTYGSFCSGIEAATAAWHPLGWRPAFFSEIEPIPCAVLAHHYPTVPNLGDMTKVDGSAWRGRVDVLVAGTPCQSFSIAGLRRGLSDHRGNLTLAFVELVHDILPEFVVWENVPGILSAQDNAFGCFLAGLVGETEPLVSRDGTWPNAGMVAGPERTAAWRILDAQYFGLAQRQRRVFVVSCRTGDGHNPGAILFEPESLPGNPAPSREAGARVAAGLTRGADSGGAGGYAGRRREDDTNIVVNALDRHMGSGGPDDNAAQANHLIADNIVHSLRADGFDASEDGTGRGTPIVPVTYPCLRGGNQYNNSDPGMEASMLVPVAFDWQSGGDSRGLDPKHTANLQRCQVPAIAFAQNQRDEIRTMSVAGSVSAEPGMKQQTYVASQTRIARNGRGQPEEICPTLQGADAGATSDMRPVIATTMAVRRLTPRECERLQGFPDDYTLIPYRGKPAADGPRYRALGNSMAVPVMRWIGERIIKFMAAVEQRKRGAA